MEHLLKKQYPPKHVSACCGVAIITDEEGLRTCAFCDREVCDECDDTLQIEVGQYDDINIVPCPFHGGEWEE